MPSAYIHESSANDKGANQTLNETRLLRSAELTEVIQFPTRTARTETRTDDSQGLKINNRDILRKKNDGGGAEAAGRMSSDRDGSRGIRGSPPSSVPELQ